MAINKTLLKKIFLLSVGVVLFIGAYFLFFKKNKPQTSYLTETIVRGNIEKTIVATGTVRSNDRVEVGAQASGKITNINVKVGQFVKKGDLLVTIDSMTQENDLKDAKSKLASYEAQLKNKKVVLELAQSYYTRISKLYKIKSASQDDYETGQQNLASAMSSVREIEELIIQAKIYVKIAETNLSYTTIFSPIDGVIISIPVSVGQTINSTQVTPLLLQVADLKKMLIKPEIPEGDITSVAPGMSVEFTTLSNPELTFKSKIESVDPVPTTLIDDEYKESVTDTNAIYYYANILIDNLENNLRIGMTTTNIIKVASAENVLLVPTPAIIKKDNKYFVKILNGKDEVIEKNIALGLSDDINTEIKSGLEEGDKVILSQMSAGESLENSKNGPPGGF